MTTLEPAWSERAAGVAERIEQLRARIERLRDGHPVTDDDARRARAAAVQQQVEAERARGRLMDTRAAAVVARRTGRTRPTVGVGDRPEDELLDARGRPATEQLSSGADEVLQQAVVTIASWGGTGVEPGLEHRQRIWRAMVGRCGSRSWKGWNDALCQVLPSMLPGVRGAAVCGYDVHGRAHLLAATDAWSRRLEEAAQLVGEGPGADAYSTQSAVLVHDLDDEQVRWPGYTAVTAGAGAGSIAAFALQLSGVPLGSLTVYFAERYALQGRGSFDLSFLPTLATQTLLLDLDASESDLPWPGDDPVATASGVLAERLGLDVEDALARLRAYAFGHARSLVDVAREVLDGSLTII